MSQTPSLKTCCSLACTLLLLNCAAAASGLQPQRLAVSDVCTTCMLGVRLFEDFLCDPFATEFLVDFAEKEVCPSLGDSEQCHNLAEGLIPVAIQWFRGAADPASLCSATGVCGASLLQNSFYNKPAARNVRDTTECAMCKFVIERVKIQINDSRVMDDIKDKSLEICAQLPETLADACTDFVNQYEPLMEVLVQDMDPGEVCALMGTCMEALVAVKAPALPAELVLALAGVHKMLMKPQGVQPSNDGCDYCKMAILEAHSLISNPQVQQSLVNYTKSACDNFPGFADQCKLYVDQYALLVFTLLETYLVPDQLCVQVGMCPAVGTWEAECGWSKIKHLFQRKMLI